MLIEQSRPQHLNDLEAARHRKRGVSLSELPNGMFRLVGLLDTVAGQRLRDALVAAMDRAGAGDVPSAARTPWMMWSRPGLRRGARWGLTA